MLLPHAETLGLKLKTDPSFGVLRTFSPQIQQSIVHQVATNLQTPLRSKDALATAEHVRWVQEVLGCGFGLSVSYDATIKACVDVYKWWLLGSSVEKPESLVGTEALVWPRIFRHFTLLFDTRDGQNVDAHSALCRQVLEIVTDLTDSFEAKEILTEEIWDRLMRCMLTMVDSMLTMMVTHHRLGTALCDMAFRTLLLVWMRSGTRCPDLWERFSHIYSNWVHRMPVVDIWGNLVLSVTQKVVRELYGSPHGSDQAILSTQSGTFPLFLETSHLMECWLRFIHLLPNTLDITDARILLSHVTGVAAIVDVFVSVGRDGVRSIDSTAPQPPSRVSLLQTFGRSLYTTLSRPAVRFARARAVAAGALMNIFSAPHLGSYPRDHLTTFFHSISPAIAESSRISAATVPHIPALLSTRMEGATMLLVPIVRLMSSFLPRAHPEIDAQPEEIQTLRENCVPVVASMAAFAQHMKSTPLRYPLDRARTKVDTAAGPASNLGLQAISGGDPVEVTRLATIRQRLYAKLPVVTKFNDLVPHITYLCLEGVHVDTSPKNAKSLMNALVSSVFTLANTEPLFCLAGPLFILRLLNTNPMYGEADLAVAALRSIEAMAPLHSHGLKVPDGGGLARSLVSGLCGLASEYAKAVLGGGGEANSSSSTLSSPPSSSPGSLKLAAVLSCIEAWIVSGDISFLHSDVALSDAVSQVAAGVLGTVAGLKAVGESAMHLAALSLFQAVYLRAGVQALRHSPVMSTSVVSHIDILKEWGLLPEDHPDGAPLPESAAAHCRHYCLDEECVVSVIEPPTEGGAGCPSSPPPPVAVVVRTAAGCFVWEAEFLQDHSVNRDSKIGEIHRTLPAPTDAVQCEHPARGVPETLDSQLDSSHGMDTAAQRIRSQAGDATGTRTAEAVDAVVSSATISDESRPAHPLGPMALETPPLPKSPYTEGHRFHLGRLLLHHMGFVSLRRSVGLCRIPHSEAGEKALSRLDGLGVRARLSACVTLVRHGQVCREESLGNTGGPPLYRGLLQGLGWAVDREPGFWCKGMSKTPSSDQGAAVLPSDVVNGLPEGAEAPQLFHAGPMETLSWYVPSLLPVDTPAAVRASMVSQQTVEVMYVEDVVDALPVSSEAALVILVSPVPSGLFRVRIFSPQGKVPKTVGPLVDNALVAPEAVASLVRATVVSGWRTADPIPCAAPLASRISQISAVEELASPARVEANASAFYKDLMTSS